MSSQPVAKTIGLKQLPDYLDPSKFNLGNVIQGRSGKRINKSLQEMIYNTLFAKRSWSPAGIYVGEYCNTHFHYELPTQWYNSATYNRSIGLRNIRALPKAFTITLYIYIWYYNGGAQLRVVPMHLHFTPSDDTNEIMSQIIFQMNTFAQKAYINSGTMPEFFFAYENTTLYIGAHNVRTDPNKQEIQYYWFMANERLTIRNYNAQTNTFFAGAPTIEDSMRRFLNLQPASEWPNNGNGYRTYDVSLFDDGLLTVYTFNNVWDRDRLYVHASFVSYTPFQYSGQNGEFYQKPSKIY
jgi:hypothetical protein